MVLHVRCVYSSYLYFASFGCVVIGLVLYNSAPSPSAFAVTGDTDGDDDDEALADRYDAVASLPGDLEANRQAEGTDDMGVEGSERDTRPMLLSGSKGHQAAYDSM